MRPSYYGSEIVNPVTGQKELHYPAWKRRLKFVASAVVTAAMLAVAFSVMVCSLNLQGYIRAIDRFDRRNPFYVSALARFAEPGAVFDPNGFILWTLIPVVCHSAIIFVLNQLVYRRIAEALTRWENHRTEQEFANALVLKRFCFEFFDCYIALFYLAFYECDALRLQAELASLFAIDCVRRLATETVVPMAFHIYSISRRGKAPTVLQALEAAAEDAEGAETLEDFDDFLEMTIQLGYMSLFAGVFPLAPFLSFFTNLVELRSDATKLAWVVRKPRVARVADIGVWETLTTAIAWASILTNVLVFGFVSEQFAQLTPDLFKRVEVADGASEAVLGDGVGRHAVGGLWALEHILIIAALAIHVCVKDMPKPIRQLLHRRLYRKTLLARTRRREEAEKLRREREE